MISEIEKKFYEYLDIQLDIIGLDIIAHGLAEIAEQDYERINDARKAQIEYSIRLQREVKELKKQLETPTEYCYKEEDVENYKEQIVKLKNLLSCPTKQG